MTVKVYNVRIDTYLLEMEITESLRKSQLDGDVTLTLDYLNDIVSQLDLWYSSRAGYVLSRNSAQRFAALRKIIREEPESKGMYSPKQIDRMVSARREFRIALRADILLLFIEDDVLEVDFLED